MKNNLKFILQIVLLTTISCINQYYLTDPKYSEDGRIFSGILYFEGEFVPENYSYD